jgi:hypothetical protein
MQRASALAQACALAALLLGSNGLKVAFVGDTGVNGSTAGAVFAQLRREGVELVLQNGDLDYAPESPERWDSFLEASLGGKMNLLETSGNHEEMWGSKRTGSVYGAKWQIPGGYRDKAIARYLNSSLAGACEGDFGNRMSCIVDGVHIVGLGWNQTVVEPGGWNASAVFMDEAFKAFPLAKWRLAFWHAPASSLALGYNQDLPAAAALYEVARKWGAFVSNGHVHNYARTKVIAQYSFDLGTYPVPSPGSRKQLPTLSCGETFSVTTGMGGFEFEAAGPDLANQKYWDAYYALANGTKAVEGAPKAWGALICDFPTARNAKEPDRAPCRFMVNGAQGKVSDVVDRFTIRNKAHGVDCGRRLFMHAPRRTELHRAILRATSQEHVRHTGDT